MRNLVPFAVVGSNTIIEVLSIQNQSDGNDFHCTMQQELTFLEGGVFHGQNGSQNFRFYKCYDICFHNFCDKHPLMGKNAS